MRGFSLMDLRISVQDTALHTAQHPPTCCAFAYKHNLYRMLILLVLVLSIWQRKYMHRAKGKYVSSSADSATMPSGKEIWFVWLTTEKRHAFRITQLIWHGCQWFDPKFIQPNKAFGKLTEGSDTYKMQRHTDSSCLQERNKGGDMCQDGTCLPLPSSHRFCCGLEYVSPKSAAACAG